MRHLIFFIFILFLFHSCVYENSDNHFIEISQDIDPPTIVNTTLDFEADTIYVWQNTQLSFDLSSSHQNIYGVIVEFDNQQRMFESSSGSFDISPFNMQDGSHELVMKVYVGSGTGSLADQLGAEQLEFSRTWVLITEKPSPPDIQFHNFEIENGFLKISWEKMDKPYFNSYRLVVNNKGIHDVYSHDFTNQNNTTFIDSFFVGGELEADLWIYYDNGKGSTDIHRIEAEYNHDIPIHYEENMDSLKLSWENPFQCTVVYGVNSQDRISVESAHSLSVKAPGLGQERRYMLAFKPLKENTFDHQMYYKYFSYTKGQQLSSKFGNIVYNSNLNSYFAKYAMNIIKYDHSMTEKARYDFSYDYHDELTIAFSNNNQYLYSVIKQELVQLNTNDLQKYSSINLHYGKDFDVRTKHMVKLNDKLILLAYDSYFGVFDTETGNLNAKTPYIHSYGSEKSFSISSDKRFVSFCNNKGLYIYELINNNEFVLIYNDQNSYIFGFFHPTQPGLFIINGEEFVHVFNYEQKQIINTIENPVANPINIDPDTGDLLLVSNSKDKIYIYDLEENKVRFEINHHDRALNFKLLNNIIFHNSGTYYHVQE